MSSLAEAKPSGEDRGEERAENVVRRPGPTEGDL